MTKLKMENSLGHGRREMIIIKEYVQTFCTRINKISKSF